MPTNSTILTYHSQNIAGFDTCDNDHVALAADLEALFCAGVQVIPLSRLVDNLDGTTDKDLSGTVCLTFDDGCDFDVRDLDYPEFGVQRSFAGIMQDFIQRNGEGAQPDLHATTFVIASARARKIIDERSLFGKCWISDNWWKETDQEGLISIANHGWDHNHPDLLEGEVSEGEFNSVNTFEECKKQVVDSAEFIFEKTGTWPDLFAYPFGESSDYIREAFFPQGLANHRCRAALGTDKGKVTNESDRWNLPRYVCGRDWRDPKELLELLSG
jgi:peptidoglycan/xylan/chitin deacetylase (PgdA/CDA1 family)